MTTIFKHIKGDKYIWAIISLLALFSFLPVFSASSNLVNLYGKNSIGLLLKHAFHLSVGFAVMYGVHKMPPHYFKGLSKIGLPIVIALLLYTMFFGITRGGATRWVGIPIIGASFQTSTLAAVVLMVYVAQYLSNIKGEVVTFKGSFIKLWIPVGIILALILPSNLSTTAIIFTMVLMLTFVGGYSLKYIGYILGLGLVLLLLFGLTAKAFPDAFPNRVETWVSRVENFSNGEDTAEDYQIERAKMAIASGGLTGLGPGKSVQKNFLPQSSSDFIYAIIVEEWGLFVGVFILVLYLSLLFRMIVLVNKTTNLFGKFVVIGVGFPIIFQAFINMAVATELFPVTGQTLPLISSGGTSIWITCAALGVILSVSSHTKAVVKKAKLTQTDNPLDVLTQTM